MWEFHISSSRHPGDDYSAQLRWANIRMIRPSQLDRPAHFLQRSKRQKKKGGSCECVHWTSITSWMPVQHYGTCKGWTQLIFRDWRCRHMIDGWLHSETQHSRITFIKLQVFGSSESSNIPPETWHSLCVDCGIPLSRRRSLHPSSRRRRPKFKITLCGKPKGTQWAFGAPPLEACASMLLLIPTLKLE